MFQATATLTLEVEFPDREAVHEAALRESRRLLPRAEADQVSETLRTDLDAALVMILDPRVSPENADVIKVVKTSTTVARVEEVVLPPEDDSAAGNPFEVSYLLAKSTEVAGLVPDDAADRDLVRYSLLKGLLWQASRALTDDAFYDLELVTHPDFSLEGTLVLSELPARFAAHYDAEFARRFLTAILDVSRSLSSGLGRPATLAHALATRLLFRQAEFYAREYALPVPEKWRENLESILFEDLPMQALYQQSHRDCLESLETDFTWWFTPISTSGGASPYATD